MPKKQQVVKYDITSAAISKMNSIYMALNITDLEDKDEFKAVHDARMVVKGHRVSVEKRRKELKKGALEYGREVDNKAKGIFVLLEPIETHLQTEEDKVVEEQKRIEAEEDRKQREKISTRIMDLGRYRVILPHLEVSTMTDEEFDTALAEAKADWDAEEKRQANAEAARRAEDAQLEKIRKDQEAEAARLAGIQAAQEAEQTAREAANKVREDEIAAKEKKVRDEQDRIAKVEADKKAAEEAKIQAKIDARELLERQAKEKADKEKRAAEEVARQEALKPDKKKLLEWLKTVSIAVINCPAKLKDEGMFNKSLDLISELTELIRKLEEQIEAL